MTIGRATLALVPAALWLAVLLAAPPAGIVRFVDVTAASGISFKHDNAASPEKYLTETMGSGAAWLDYDGDGYVDLYLVNSAGSSALYRNNGDGSFTDVTSKAGVAATGLRRSQAKAICAWLTPHAVTTVLSRAAFHRRTRGICTKRLGGSCCATRPPPKMPPPSV